MNPDEHVTLTMAAQELAELRDNAQIGIILAGWVASCVRLGHSSPASTLDYTHETDGTEDGLNGPSMFVRDFVAWTSGRKHLAEGCEERMRAFGEVEGSERIHQMASARRGRAS